MKYSIINKKKGTVTIFAALILASVILLNSVLTDSARVITAKANLNYKLTLAAKSLLAAFDNILYKDYGLTAAAENQDSAITAEYYFMGSSISVSDLFNDSKYLDIIPVKGQLEGLSSEYTDSLADINVLQEQIVNLMEYKSPANLLELVLESLKILKAGQDTSEGEYLYREACSLLDDISKKADKLYRAVEGWSENDITSINGFDNSISRKTIISNIKKDSFLLQGRTFSVLINGNEAAVLNDIKSNCLKLKSEYETYAQLNRNAISLIAEIQQLRLQITPRITEMKNWISSAVVETETEQQYIDKLKERVEELEIILRKTQYQGLRQKLEENLEILNKEIDQMRLLYEHLSAQNETVLSYDFVCDCIENAECSNMNTDINVYTGNTGVNMSLAEEDPREKGAASQEDILSNIETLLEIDQELYETLPSVSESFSEMNLSDTSTVTNILIDDYILTYFGNSSDTGYAGRSGFFQAETEYILNGNASEKVNIENTTLKIFGFRTGLNLIHVLCDNDKREMALAIGNALAGAATYGIGGPLYAALVIAAWAAAEAALDVQALKNGDEVPLIKTTENWKLSIEGIDNKLSDEVKDEIKNDKNYSDFKMDYKGYLRLLLFMTPQKNKLGRIQDLIELNLSDLTGKRYYLGNYFCGIKLKCNFTIAGTIADIKITEETNVTY